MVTLESKIVVLYCSALFGASLSEIEVCRVGNWSCEPFRGVILVLLSASPMLVILICTPMKRYVLAALGVVVFAVLLWLGLDAAHTESSLTWAFVFASLWFFGMIVAIALFVVLKSHHNRTIIKEKLASAVPSRSSEPLLQDQTFDDSFVSNTHKLTYLVTGASVGTLLGQIGVYNANFELSLQFGLIVTLIANVLVWLYFSICILAPMLLLLWQRDMNKKEATVWSIIIGALVFVCYMLLPYYIGLGLLILWWSAGIVVAFVLLIRKVIAQCGIEQRQPPPADVANRP